MLFFVDESGDFAVPRHASEHRVAVVSAIAISEAISQPLEREYREFVGRLDSSELQGGEPKGKLLSYQHREQFCDLLARFDGISFTPVTLDLSSLGRRYYEESATRMQETILENVGRMVHQTAREELLLAARQYGNLSGHQALRLYAVACAIQEGLQHAILFLSQEPHDSSWSQVRIEIDRVQTKALSREEQLFSVMLRGWLLGWSVATPMIFIQEVHTPQHPLNALYDTPAGFSLGRMLKSNPYWVCSSESWGVQIADIAAAIVYQAAMDLDDRNGAASIYASLMRSSYYGPIHGPGLITPLTEVPELVSGKYMLLMEVMKRNAPKQEEDA